MKKPTNILKRNGEEAAFDRQKIYNAVNAANKEVDPIHQLSSYQMDAVTSIVTEQIAEQNTARKQETVHKATKMSVSGLSKYLTAPSRSRPFSLQHFQIQPFMQHLHQMTV